MTPSMIAFQLVIVIYVIKITVPTKSYKNGLRITVEPQNNSNTNHIDHHYGYTSKKFSIHTASSSLIKRELANNTRKLQTKSILIPKGNATDSKDGHNIPSSPPFQNDQKIVLSLAIQHNKCYLFNHGEYRQRPEESPNSNNIQERTALLSAEVSSAQQPVLVELLLVKTKMTSEDRPTSKCSNASDSVHIPPVIRLINYIAERYLYHCISVILYDDFYETQFHLLRALFSTYPLTYAHGKVGRQELTDPPDMRCTDFLLLVRDLKTTQAVVGDQSVSRVIVVSQASTWRIREFLSSRLSQNLVNLLVIGNQNQVSHKSATSSNQNFRIIRFECPMGTGGAFPRGIAVGA
jgi:hypothetical protein